MSKPKVAVVFGSDSDWTVMEKCVAQLRAFDIEPMIEVMSAHRNPTRVHEFARDARADGIEVVIAGAGMSAALAGTVAAVTTVPVIGVPLASGTLQGVDALLSTAQMPPGVPVACVGIGEAGAKNAALLAVQILAGADARLADRYAQFKEDQARSIEDKNRALQKRIRS